MSSAEDPTVWIQMYDQLPPIIRWVLVILSGGLISILAYLYRRERETVRRVEQQVHARMDRNEAALEEIRKDTNRRLDTMNKHLLQIARNTSRDESDE